MQKIIHTIGARIPRLNTPAKASVAYLLSAAIMKGAAFIFTPILTRILTGEEYGALSLFSSYVSLLSLFCSLEIGSGVIYKLFQREKENQDEIFTASLVITLLSSLLSFGIFSAIATVIGIEMPFVGAPLIIFLSSLFGSLNRLTLAREKYSYRYRAVIYSALTEGILPGLLTILIYRISGSVSAEIRAAVGAIVAIIFFFSCIYAIQKRQGLLWAGPLKFLSLSHLILKTALPMLPYYAAVLTLSVLDRAIIGNTLGKNSLAVYTVGHSAGLALSFLSAAVSQALYPWIIRRLSGGGERVRGLSRFLALVFASLSVAFCALIPEIIGILAPTSCSGAAEVAYIISAAVLPLFLSGITNCISLYKCASTSSVIAGVLSAVLSAILNIFLTPAFGILASATVCLVSYTALFGISSLILKIKSGFTIINVYSYLQISLFCAVVSAASYILRGVFLARIPILILALVFLISVVFKNKRLIFE